MNHDSELPDLLQPDTVVPVVREDTSAQRRALQKRAAAQKGRMNASSPESRFA